MIFLDRLKAGRKVSYAVLSETFIEAATALGFSRRDTLFNIILPQAFRVTIPPLLGQAIVLVKDSALLSLISVPELTRAGQLLASNRFMPAEAFITVAACYLLLYYGLKGLARGSERWLGSRTVRSRA